LRLACEERGELADRLGVLAFFPDGVRIRAAPPLGESDTMSWSILIDENLMRSMMIRLLNPLVF